MNRWWWYERVEIVSESRHAISPVKFKKKSFDLRNYGWIIAWVCEENIEIVQEFNYIFRVCLLTMFNKTMMRAVKKQENSKHSFDEQNNGEKCTENFLKQRLPKGQF